MAIASVADYLASYRQTLRINKAGNSSVGQNNWQSATMLDAGDPPVGAISIGNITSGVVPTDATVGFPAINAFPGTGYITNVDCTFGQNAGGSYTGAFMLYDRLFHAGTFPNGVGATTLTGQPSFSSRIPDGTNYAGLQIWAEAAVGGSGNGTAHCTYTNQSGDTGRVSGIVTKLSNVSGFCVQLPLASGDCGASTIESFVVDTDTSSCRWNVMIIRPLCVIRLPQPFREVRQFIPQIGMPQVWSDSALGIMTLPIGVNATPQVEAIIEIASA